jgi:hypothetical protein
MCVVLLALRVNVSLELKVPEIAEREANGTSVSW